MIADRSLSLAELAPFRGGRGGLRMGLAAVPSARWLDRGPLRAGRAAARSGASDAMASYMALPGSEAAQDEVMRQVVRALELDRLGGGDPPLVRAARQTFEDLCILQTDGRQFVLTAGVVSFPTNWRLADKIGRTVADIHAAVPGYGEKLADSVDQFLRKLPAGPVFERSNWFVVDDPALRYLPSRPAHLRFAGVTPDNAGERLAVRCERQTLRRMPMTGAIVFAIGVYVEPLHALPPRLLGDLALAVAGLAETEALYRHSACYAAALAGYAERRLASA